MINVMFFNELPSSALALICTCTNTRAIWSGYREPISWSRVFYGRCKGCRKQRIEYLWKCECCTEYFVKNFKHPNWCIKVPRCFKCLEHTAHDLCTCSGRKCVWHPLDIGEKVPPFVPKRAPYIEDFDPLTYELGIPNVKPDPKSGRLL